jgi:hypothetical protein
MTTHAPKNLNDIQQISSWEADSRSASHKLLPLYGTRKFIDLFIRACNWPLSWVRWIYFTRLHAIYITYTCILISSSCLLLCIQTCIFPGYFLINLYRHVASCPCYDLALVTLIWYGKQQELCISLIYYCLRLSKRAEIQVGLSTGYWYYITDCRLVHCSLFEQFNYFRLIFTSAMECYALAVSLPYLIYVCTSIYLILSRPFAVEYFIKCPHPCYLPMVRQRFPVWM